MGPCLDSTRELYDVVGPICESSDVIGFDRYLPRLSQGDYLMICDVGAYGFVMAHHYNKHELPDEIAYSGEKFCEEKCKGSPLGELLRHLRRRFTSTYRKVRLSVRSSWVPRISSKL